MTHRLALVAAALVLAASPGARAASPVPAFGHVIVVIFENKDEGQVIGSSEAPTFTQLAKRYVRLTHYDAITHPSLPNYLALISGSTHGVRRDCTRCVVDAPNLSDTLAAAGRSWKAYAEGLPRPGYTGARHGLYVRRHVPFLYFRDVLMRLPTHPQRSIAQLTPRGWAQHFARSAAA